MIEASCHCGSIEIALVAKPDYINLCDCTLCAKSGGAWGYFKNADVTVKGDTSGYRRIDYPKPAVEIKFCPRCGNTTHWALTEHHPGDQIGVNMRLFDPATIEGIEARTLDGHNWTGDGPVQHRREPGVLGKDVFL